MYPHLLTLLCISLLILAGCGPDASSSTGGGGLPEALAQASPTAQFFGSSSPVIRKGTTLSTPIPVKTASSPNLTEEPVAPSSPEPTGTIFRLCSPLVDTPLEELRLIVSDPYRPPPPPGSEARHQGVDFAYFRKFNRAAIEGAGIQSILTGQVAAAVVDSFPYGNMLIIETPAGSLPAGIAERIRIGEGQSLYVLYAHMERPSSLALGDHLDACQAIGTVGKSGNAGGAHLHLETRLGPAGTRFAGISYYKAWATEEQRANYLLWRTSGTYTHFDPMLLLTGE